MDGSCGKVVGVSIEDSMLIKDLAERHLRDNRLSEEGERLHRPMREDIRSLP